MIGDMMGDLVSEGFFFIMGISGQQKMMFWGEKKYGWMDGQTRVITTYPNFLKKVWV